MSNLSIKVKNDLTPIEVLLGVDDEGKTTAKKLYEFLQLNPAVYARWVRTNILKNEFAEEGTDWVLLNIDVERTNTGFKNPKPTKDYKLTASFAKKLAMKSHSERGEQARNYFVKVEDKLKDLALKRRDNEYINRQISKEVRKTLTDAIEEAGLNKEMKGFAYPTFTNKIYSLALGMSAKKYREKNSLPAKANIREYLSEDQLRIIAKVEKLVTAMVDNGFKYQDVKIFLEDQFAKKLTS